MGRSDNPLGPSEGPSRHAERNHSEVRSNQRRNNGANFTDIALPAGCPIWRGGNPLTTNPRPGAASPFGFVFLQGRVLYFSLYFFSPPTSPSFLFFPPP